MTGILRRNGVLWIVIALVALSPLVLSQFTVTFLLTKILIFGMVAASLIFLSAYAGTVSLAQTTMFGVAAFMVGNFAASQGGLGFELNPWLAVVLSLLVTAVVALIFGAVAARSTEIYFLMLTLTYAVIGFQFFDKVIEFSGPSGIRTIARPSPFDCGGACYPTFYAALVASVLAFYGLRALSRTPFGIALQGVRDDPVRMASLGFNVPLMRTIAFVITGVVAGIAGVLFVWWQPIIGPKSIGVGPTIDILVIAVVGGIMRLEGAWIGATLFILAETYIEKIPGIDLVGGEQRYRTVVGLVVLLVMVVSPNGLMGMYDKIRGRRAPATVPVTTTDTNKDSEAEQAPA